MDVNYAMQDFVLREIEPVVRKAGVVYDADPFSPIARSLLSSAPMAWRIRSGCQPGFSWIDGIGARNRGAL